MMREPRSVVITGASRGLGLASAAHLYQLGWRVVAAMRSPDSGLERLRAATGAAADDSRLVGVRLDLDDMASVVAAAKAIEEVVGAHARETVGHEADVVILDTLGELAQVYQLATVVFVGGSNRTAQGTALTANAWTHLAATVRSATQAAQKTVRIEIDTSDLEELKGANYKLCFAKKVGDDYDVVWQSYTKYLPSNTFSWTPQYQLFGANVFNDRVNVEVSTNLVSIGLGETCILDSAGVLLDPSTSGPTDSITMNNKFNLIHPGIKQLSTGIDGAQISTAIYVAPKPAVMGPVVLTPVEKVLVWFEQDIVTSTMFSDARSNAVEIDLTLSDAQTRLYKDQQWSKPPAE
jgi:hypothetical protein